MKPHALAACLLGILFFGSLASSQREHPTETPGKLEIAKHPLELEPPPRPPTRRTDLVKLRDEAEELSKLAASVPSDVNQLSEGKLPKDLSGNLKRIERLAKSLRAGLTP